MRAGIVGLGRMGYPIALHLLAAGYELTAYDCQPEPCRLLSERGAKIAADCAGVAPESEIVLICVGFDKEVKEVILDPAGGLLKGCKSGTALAILSTVHPHTVQKLAESCARQGVEIIDAPLCRGEDAARAGTLLLMVGGNPRVVEKYRPLLASFATDIEYLGGPGSGQVGKTVNNLLLWACTCANQEGLDLGERYGVDSERLRLALLKSSGNNWSLEQWRNNRKMPWAEKDMSIILDMADRVRLPVPVCGVTKEAIKYIKIARNLPTPRPREE